MHTECGNVSSLLFNQTISVNFSPLQKLPESHKLGDLIAERVARKEFFYGIEVSAHSLNEAFNLDYQIFDTLLPLFTSLVWFGRDYADVKSFEDVASLRVCRQLLPRTIVMPHFTAFRVDRDRLQNFLAVNFSNVLALRGDLVDPSQQYQHANQLVDEIRRIRSNTISIGVAGYPDGHPDSKSKKEEMYYLQQKIFAGGDFIITQVCFSGEKIVQFVRECRAANITVPIVVGVLVPDNWRMLTNMLQITHAFMSVEDRLQYRELMEKPTDFRDFAIRKAVEMISMISERDIGIYGFQFFTMNKLKNVKRVLNELTSNKNYQNKVKT